MRIGEKRSIGSTGSRHDEGIQLDFYEYPVYCDRSVLVGEMLQTAIIKDMPTNTPDWLKPCGLSSMLTTNIYAGLAVVYWGRSTPIEMAQYMQISELVNESSSHKMRLLGHMDVHLGLVPLLLHYPKAFVSSKDSMEAIRHLSLQSRLFPLLLS